MAVEERCQPGGTDSDPGEHDGEQDAGDRAMTARLLDGRALAARVRGAVAANIERCRKAGAHRPPGLAVVLVGDDPASRIYVEKKRLACEEVGIAACIHALPATTTAKALTDVVAQLNAAAAMDGIVVQLPLPPPLDPVVIAGLVDAGKDVDGLHPFNMGRLAVREPLLRPCTPWGIMRLLETTGLALHGAEAVVVGASSIVGRPMALELLLAGATVTVCHRFTRDLENHVRRAEVLVVAVGRPGLIPGAWIRPGAVVVDVGMNRLADGRLTGDVDFETAREHAAWITPVPGGVGPMTVATLLENTLRCYLTHLGIDHSREPA